MGELLGLKDYLAQNYDRSVFDEALESGQAYMLHMHGQKNIQVIVSENLVYDIKADIEGKEDIIQKIDIKFLYPARLKESVMPLLKEDKKVKDLGLEPIPRPNKRFFVKNKSLFPLMKEKEVVFFTLLEGEIIRGIITGFTRYDITVNLKGGKPVTILRHSVYDLRNKKGRCFLKHFQEQHRDWEKSPLSVSQ